MPPLQLRRALTATLIRLGPGSKIVSVLISRECRKFGVTARKDAGFWSLCRNECEMRIAPKHFVYAPTLAERFDDYFELLVPAPMAGKLVLDYSRPGNLQTYVRSGLQFELASFPEEDSAIDGYFRWYRPQAGDLVFDIGAHCGVSTYEFSKLVGGTGRVVAFEPDPVNFSLLIRNIERHKLDNVTPVQSAVAGSRGRAGFSCEETIGSKLMRHSSRSSVGRVVMIDTITLEDAFRGLGVPQFCKIDIEGSEVETLSGAQQFLQTERPYSHFAVDTNHLLEGSLTDARVEELFRASGYEAESSPVSGFMTTWARPA
jgi:FkbM family methyltransferase